jgi:hypothetical protein
MLKIDEQLAQHIAAAIAAQAPVVKSDDWYGGGLRALSASEQNTVIGCAGRRGCNVEFTRGTFGMGLRVWPVAVHKREPALAGVN